MLRSVSAPWDFFFQMTHSGVIDVNPDRQTATARWQVQEIARSPDGSHSYDNVAIYYDRLARTDDGSWRFAERRYDYVWVSTADPGGLGPSRGCPGMMALRHCGELQPARPQPPLRPRRSAVGTPTSPAQIR